MLTTVLAILLLVLLGLLAIPLGLDYRMNWQGTFQGDIHLIWLFGLVHVQIPTESASSAHHAEPTPSKPKRRRNKNKRKFNPLVAWRLRPFRHRIIRFARDLWQAIHKHELRVQLRIGFDDPADTGQLWAFMGPLSAIASNSQTLDVAIEPDFMHSTFEFSSSGRIRLIPLQLLGLTFALLLSPPFWYGLQQMRKGR